MGEYHFNGVNDNSKLIHCTIANNVSGSYGGGVLKRNSGQIEFINSILWHNEAEYGEQAYYGGYGY